MADLFSQPEPVKKGTDDLFRLLEKLLDDGVLKPEDVEFPRWLYERSGESDASVLLAAAHLTSLTRQGHVGTRIPLQTDKVPLFGRERILDLSPEQHRALNNWTSDMEQSIRESGVVGTLQDPDYPLIFDRGYLYYQRYWSYECTLAGQLLQRAGKKMDDFVGMERMDWISTLLPGRDDGSRWQQLALWMALRRRLLVLTGGPGTGKTFTLIRLVALQKLLFQNQAREPGNWKVALAAPTGKAAARINESVRESVQDLKAKVPDDVVETLPRQAQTIHRLLGSRGRRPEFRHNRENPLPYDVVVVDEASMVDIGLMTKLTEALKPGAQLILIGDKDQLASVEAGSVLGDICQPLRSDSDQDRLPVNTFSPEFNAELQNGPQQELPDDVIISGASDLLDCMVELTRSRRFENAPGIGKLAELVNREAGQQAVECMQSAREVNIELPQYLGDIRQKCEEWDYLGQNFTLNRVFELFQAWNRFQILAAHRRGPRSARAVNQLMEHWMQEHKEEYRVREAREWYPGRPIIVTENNYELNLFNGDIGLTARDPERDGQLRVVFEKQAASGESAYRSVAPAQLTHYEPAWALTVHKSQGSEFSEVLLLMPDRLSPVLTRELVYTALTRSRQYFTVWSESELFKKAIQQRIIRTSALGLRLWGD